MQKDPLNKVGDADFVRCGEIIFPIEEVDQIERVLIKTLAVLIAFAIGGSLGFGRTFVPRA